MSIKTNAKKRQQIFFLIGCVVLAVVLGLVTWVIIVTSKNNKMERELNQLETTNQDRERKAYKASKQIRAGEPLIEGVNIEEYNTVADIDKSFFWDGEADSIAAVSMRSGVPILKEMVVENSTEFDVHEMEYSCITISSNIQKDDFIDVRIVYPDGTNQIVLAKKRIIRLEQDNTVVDLAVTEEDIQLMTSAVVDMVLYEGAYLYADKYVTPAQSARVITYVPSVQTSAIIRTTPNIQTIVNQYLEQELRQKKETGLDIFTADESQYDANGNVIKKPTLSEILGRNNVLVEDEDNHLVRSDGSESGQRADREGEQP